MPTQRWKQVPVSWPSLLCILFWFTTSSALSAMCRNLLTGMPDMDDLADASSGSAFARSYVAATALMDGRITGWSTGSFTSCPKRYTLSFLPRRLCM